MDVGATIAALASPPGLAARAVVRVSGPSSAASVRTVFSPNDAAAWADAAVPTRYAGSVRLDGVAVPAACQLWPTSRSYTGEPAAELHLPGGDVLAGVVLEALQAAGVRPAARGEFTLRAFLAGRLDLTQAEAVLGVIDADDPAALEGALSQLAGGLSMPLAELHEQLIVDLADLEAGLDFADEDLDFVSRAAFAGRLAAARRLVDELLRQAGERTVDEAVATVVLNGPPNAGKSTLFNALLGRDAAIVSNLAGTTRDDLRGDWHLPGRTVRLIDTAGEDAGLDAVTLAAETRRRDRVAAADVVLQCGVDDARPAGPNVILVQTKSDLGHAAVAGAVAVSARTGAGLAELARAVERRLDRDPSERGGLVATTAARCRGSLKLADQRLTMAASLLAAGGGDELVAEELRGALAAIGRVLGQVSPDDVLDRVFSRFCIGK